MYRHTDSICWLKSSKKKLKASVIGLDFFDVKCKRTEQIKPKKPAATNQTNDIKSKRNKGLDCIVIRLYVTEEPANLTKVCPSGFFNAYNASVYCIKLVTTVKTFDDGKAHCKSLGGHLLEFKTLEENVAVEKFVRERNILKQVGWFYFGIKKGEYQYSFVNIGIYKQSLG